MMVRRRTPEALARRKVWRALVRAEGALRNTQYVLMQLRPCIVGLEDLASRVAGAHAAIGKILTELEKDPPNDE